ncbi:MAG: DNA (cytosine-5-)-methyltransferase [Clostridia bacterium]|nr:DNA (cytosine-5-)-methyltransferase [Clostridia bacterium]
MIDRIRVGKRIGQKRRKLGISQTALAERLGVTSQAVSKWERGSGLPDIELLLALSRLFGTSVNALLEGGDPIAEMGLGISPSGGVYDFLAGRDLSEYDSFSDMLVRGGVMAESWRRSARADHPFREIGRRIAEAGGRILEIGAGPGGGFMPFILRADPNASVIVTDLVHGVVREWKRVLDAESDSPNLGFAVCDFTALPFPDASFDTVSDCGGIANAVGDRDRALAEAYRVLKPGGMLVTFNLFVGAEEKIPPGIRALLEAEYPDAFRDLYAETVSAGFRKIESEIVDIRSTDRDDSGFALRCREIGIRLKRTGYVRVCIKGF